MVSATGGIRHHNADIVTIVLDNNILSKGGQAHCKHVVTKTCLLVKRRVVRPPHYDNNHWSEEIRYNWRTMRTRETNNLNIQKNMKVNRTN